MKISFIVVLASATAVFILVAASYSVFYQDYEIIEDEEEENLACDSNDCVGSLESTEERDIKVCDDFYGSVCDKISKTRKFPMSIEAYMVQNSKILNLLNEPDNLKTPKTISVAKRFYSICQKHNQAEEEFKIFLEIFSKSGGFPVLEGEKFNEFDWSLLDTTRKLRKLGLYTDSLFTTKLGSNPLDLQNITFYIKTPTLDLAEKDYCGKGDECVVTFASEFSKLVMRFGATRSVALEDGIELFFLEKKLLNMVWENPKKSKQALVEDQTTTVAELSSSFGFMNWTEYFTILLGSQEYVTDELVVVVENPGYLRNLTQVLEDTPNRVLANFMMWSVLYQLEKYIPGYKRTSLDCYKLLRNTMSYAIQSMYATSINVDGAESESFVREMATKIKEELSKRVRSSDWIGFQTKEEIVEKVDGIKIKVGFPKILLNTTFIDEYYGNLSVNDKALKSMLSVHKFHADKHFALCCKRVEVTVWDLSVEAFSPEVHYDGAQNAVHVPQGALQHAVFSVDRSTGENFGRLGSVIAHEMVHAVDSVGCRYDGDGRRKRSFDDRYLATFEKKSQCFVERYNRFMEFPGEFISRNPRVSGEFKKLEIIADSVGVDLSFKAFNAYNKALSQYGGIFLIGRYISERKFFQSFAQFFCVQYSEGGLFQVLSDEHAPNSYRVRGSLRDSADFAKAFRCKNGSAMNPEEKCTVW